MARPDLLTTITRSELRSFGVEDPTSERVNAVIQLYFNHPSLHGYSRMKQWPEYYNPDTKKFESILAGFIGDTYHPGEIVVSAQTGFIRLIQQFPESSEIWRFEGLTLSRDQEGAYAGEMVSRYYRYENREAILVPRPDIRYPLRPQQILDEAVNVYPSFRIRYDLVR